MGGIASVQRNSTKFAKYKIWGPSKRKGNTSQILWLNFSGAR